MNENAPIFSFPESRESIIEEVQKRAIQKCLEKRPVEYVLNDMAYQELTRLEGSKNHHKIQYWQSLYRSLSKSSEDEKQEKLASLVNYYVNDVVGHFNPKVYQFSTSIVPHLLSFFLDPQLTFSKTDNFYDKVLIEGPIDDICELSRKGTLILVPTHSSNLDSVAIGWALFRAGLPPFTYGAGKNLFTNPILSYFMHNLGAYRVDRRLKHELYKMVLKTYSLVILEKGFHSLFFPGGTRSRSNEMEQHLKLGLLGTGLEAYVNNLHANREKPNLYVVPCTINYNLVLEAETLIDDYLKAVGKSRYIIEDDESSQFLKVLNYARKTLDLDTSLYIRFCQPVDLFGNNVDQDGYSYDRQGRQLDIKKYVVNHQGHFIQDSERDVEYTRELGLRIAEIYLENNVILAPQLVAFVLFRYLVSLNPGLDLYQLIRIGFWEARISRKQLLQIIDRFKKFLLEQEKAGIIRVGEPVKRKSIEQVLEEAIRHMQMFYSRPIVIVRENYLHVLDMKLLFYYHNRFKGYGFERHFAERFITPVVTGELSLESSLIG